MAKNMDTATDGNIIHDFKNFKKYIAGIFDDKEFVKDEKLNGFIKEEKLSLAQFITLA